MNSEEYVKPELDLVYHATLEKAIRLGHGRKKAEDMARNAVLDYFLTAR